MNGVEIVVKERTNQDAEEVREVRTDPGQEWTGLSSGAYSEED